LDDYKEAAKIGENDGECWSFYPDCPFSVFNVIPDVYTETERFNVTFDSFGAGSNVGSNEEELFKEAKITPIKIDLDLTKP
jgi:hypothetical protein